MASSSTPPSAVIRSNWATGKPPGTVLTWREVVTAVAAAVGGAAWVSAVGSGVVALRLRQADLPIEPVVALMSAEHRFAIGAGILIAPLLAGFIGFMADLVAHLRFPGYRRKLLAAVTVLAGGALVYGILRPPIETIMLQILFVAVAVPITFWLLKIVGVNRHEFYERVAVFLAVLVAAGAGAIVAEVFRSPSFDETRITLRDQAAPITGGYITSTEHSVVLSPGCEVIEAVPRDQIERISVGPNEVTRSHC